MSFRYQHGDRPLEGHTILRGVGRGGFGEVYYAVSDGGREVALKSILFNQEIELRGVRHCINLKSPHLVAIFDVRTGEDGTPFVIMEYVTGPSLRDIIRDHPEGLGSQKAAYLAREIARGLAYLHERGIVHRDLKPENIFYEEGFVKIGDYGLSKFISASHQSGQTMSVGTVHYMAPEIGSGNYHRGIDIYALGVILYEMLTGKVPFTGDSFGEILMKHLTVEADLSIIDGAFRPAIRGALAKKPDDRFPSVEVMVEQLLSSDALNSSVSLFNPASLSQAARGKGLEAAAGDGRHFAETLPVPPSPVPAPQVPATPTSASPEPPPVPTAPVAPPAGPGAREVRGQKGQNEYQQASRKLQRSLDDHNRERTGANQRKTRRPFDPTPSEASPLDPLDSTQRLMRALFVAIVSLIAMRILSDGVRNEVGMIGFLACSGGAAFGVLLTEFKLARAFQVARGFGWQLVALAAAALPVIFGAQVVRREGEFFAAIMLSMLLVDWHSRLRPLRQERISLGSALSAGLCGGLFGLMFAQEFVFAGGVLAASSLLVNAFSPYVPDDVRRRLRRQAGEAGGQARPPPGREGDAEPPAPPSVPPGEVARPETADSPKAGESLQVSAAAASTPPASGDGVLPGFPARLFWLFVAAICTAGGLPFLIASVVVDFRSHEGEELLACVCGGISFGGVAGFALYRGLWARRSGFWGRNVRPLLLVILFNAVAVSAACFTLGPTLGAWEFGREETVVSLAVLLSASFMFGVVLVVDKIALRLVSSGSEVGLPRYRRSVPVPFRALYLCLSVAAIVASLACVSIGTLDSGFTTWDRFGALSGFIVLGALGLFLLRQGLRRYRGHLWSGVVRPFLLGVVSAAIGVASLPLFLDLRLHNDEKLAFIVLTCFAVAFGVFVFFLRGPDEVRENPLVDRFRDLVSVKRGRVASSWLGLGTTLWILGVGLGLASVVVSTGLSRQLPLEGAEVEELLLFLEVEGPWLAALLLLGGGVSLVLARVGTGVLHVGRGITGQVAVLASLLLLTTAGNRITVSNGLRIHADLPRDELLLFVICGLLSGALGALLLAWPASHHAGQTPAGTAREEVA